MKLSAIVMKNFYYLIMLLLLTIVNYANAAANPEDCKVVLSKSSNQWINNYTEPRQGSTLDIIRAIKIYGDCYDKKHDASKQKLVEQERGPMMGANAYFKDLEQALEQFTKSALKVAATGGSYDRISASLAFLYLKQFRYHFYQNYFDKPHQAANSSQEIAKAKAYFSNQLKSLQPAAREKLRREFGQVYMLATFNKIIPPIIVYRYAISLLQSSEEPPFAPPPF